MVIIHPIYAPAVMKKTDINNTGPTAQRLSSPIQNSSCSAFVLLYHQHNKAIQSNIHNPTLQLSVQYFSLYSADIFAYICSILACVLLCYQTFKHKYAAIILHWTSEISVYPAIGHICTGTIATSGYIFRLPPHFVAFVSTKKRAHYLGDNSKAWSGLANVF